MLSIEIPPADPQFPQLSTSSDERASQKLALPEVDLSTPALLEETPVPKFSIRDYVLGARSKNIKENWPFSPKVLQLCLKHGVRDPLPPFQPPDVVRNLSIRGCTGESNTNKIKRKRYFDGERSGCDEHVVVDSSDDAKLNEKQGLAGKESNSCRSEGENVLPSTTTSVSQSEIESAPTSSSRPPCSPLETDILLEEAPVEVEDSGPPASRKTETKTKSLGKKYKSVLKPGNSSAENIASNCSTMSETMASKICPVCKTFASSSNTTLNAHIDQCLSVESTTPWGLGSKLTRHRIKPRKTKLMEDIYSTASKCTLEELEKRNGIMWSTVSSMAPKDVEKSETSSGGKKQKAVVVYSKDDGNAGAVYIDDSGRKLRILSMFNDSASLSKVQEDLEPREPLKGGKGSRFHYIKKKKRRGPKHHKHLKLAAQSKKSLSSQDDSSEGYNRFDESSGLEHRTKKQVRPGISRLLRQWVRHKKTGVPNSLADKQRHQLAKSKCIVSQDSLVGNDQPCLVDSRPENSELQKEVDAFDKSNHSAERSEETGNLLGGSHTSERRECSPVRKRSRHALPEELMSNNSVSPVNKEAIQLRKGGSPARDNRLLNKVDVCVSSAVGSSVHPGSGTRALRNCRLTGQSSKKSSLVNQKVLSVGGQSLTIGSNSHPARKCSTPKKSRARFRADKNEERVASQCGDDQGYGLSNKRAESRPEREESTEEVYHGRSTSLMNRKDRSALASLAPAAPYHGPDVEGNIDPSAIEDDEHQIPGFECARKVVQTVSENIIEPSSLISVKENVTDLCNSPDPEFQKLVNSFKIRPGNEKPTENCMQPRRRVEAAVGSSEPGFVDGRQTYCADEISRHHLIGENVHTGEELDSEVRFGHSFTEVDPIPIPGPPGSFLPSPGDMGSNDFQGNSSLTGSQVQSSQEQHGFNDEDSQDSPLSATSTISNFTASRSDLKYSEEPSSAKPDASQEKLSAVLSEASPMPLVETDAAVPEVTGSESEKISSIGSNLKADILSIEKGPLGRSDEQPCWCQTKERIFQDVSINYRLPLHARRRPFASMTKPSMEKHMCYNLNTPGTLDARPEFLPLNTRPDKMVVPLIKSSTGPFTLEGVPEVGAKFSGHGNCDSLSPSTPNPVLRLMGKNLMVVKKDDDESLEKPQPCPRPNYMNSPVSTFPGVLPGNIQNQEYNRYHMFSSSMNHNPCNSSARYFDAGLVKNLRNHANVKIPQALEQVRAGQRSDGGFVVSAEPLEYKSDYNLPTKSYGFKGGPNEPPICNTDGLLDTCDHRLRNGVLPANLMKEVIVIDDFPGAETRMVAPVGGGKYSRDLRGSQVKSGVAVSGDPSCNSRLASHFSSYPPQNPSLLGEPPVIRYPSFHSIPFRHANGSDVRWGCTSEGPGTQEGNPLMAISSSSAHLRSNRYKFPG